MTSCGSSRASWTRSWDSWKWRFRARVRCHREEKRELEARVERMTGKKVRARYVSNPDLLGGVMVRVGSTIYDGSVRGQLEKMRQELSMA